MAKKKPETTPYRELILPVFTQWERVGSVTNILANLEQGIFYDGSLLVEQMMRDDRVRAVVNTLIMAVLGAPMHFEAADHDDGRRSPTAEKAAEQAEDAWPQMMPKDELYELVRWAIMLGAGIARPNWARDYDSNSWTPATQTWHPGALYFNLAENEYYLYHQGGQTLISRDSPDWLLVTPYSHKYGRLNGLVRSIAMPWLARQWVFRDRARHSEVHGMPIRQGIAPAEADKKAKDLMRRDLEAVGTETVVITPQGAEGNRYDIKLIEAQSNSHEVFSAQIDHLDDCIAILVLGQRMSSKGSSGLGSDANPGDSVRRDIMRWLADVIEEAAGRLLRHWANFNFGDPELAPRLCIEVDPPADGVKKAQELSGLGDAVAKLAQHGLDIHELLEQAGVPLLDEAAAEAQRQELIQRQVDRNDAMGGSDGKTPPPGENQPTKSM